MFEDNKSNLPPSLSLLLSLNLSLCAISLSLCLAVKDELNSELIVFVDVFLLIVSQFCWAYLLSIC